MKNTVILLSLVAFGVSCNCVDGEGPVNSKTYSLEDIRGLKVSGNMDVVLQQGSPSDRYDDSATKHSGHDRDHRK